VLTFGADDHVFPGLAPTLEGDVDAAGVRGESHRPSAMTYVVAYDIPWSYHLWRLNTPANE
jgi:hypothetical protein